MIELPDSPMLKAKLLSEFVNKRDSELIKNFNLKSQLLPKPGMSN